MKSVTREDCYCLPARCPNLRIWIVSGADTSGYYDRGGTRCDLIQAEEVAKAVAKHIRSYTNKSLGVACLSVQQRDAVDDMIDKIGIRAEVEGFTPKEERLFVKNLERSRVMSAT